MPDIDAEFAPKLQCLFEPRRYKVLWGGRGAGRSWGVARALLIMGIQRSLRILCARELQNSIDESVHQVLDEQITLLGLSEFYNVQRDKIIGTNGTEFIFAGIKNNINKIRSFEGIDYCWVEEAVKVSRHSWGVLIPTIRKEGSEIWLTFNPELETDYTYRRFVLGRDDQMLVEKMTWRDNPWFPGVLRAELEHDRERDPDYYLNVWEGHCVQVLEGAVFAREIRRATEDGRICPVPWAREFPVDTFWDLGRADSTAIWFAQRVAMQTRVLGYYSNSLMDIGHYLKELQGREYVYGRHYLPHDGKAKRLGSKKTIQEIIAEKYGGLASVPVVARHSKSDSINAARLFFHSCWFDEIECEEGLRALRSYKYKVDKDGQLGKDPLHDWASDGADAFQCMALGLTGPRGQPAVRDFDQAGFAARASEAVRDIGRGATNAALGWMR